MCMLGTQSCPTLCDPMDCSPSGSSVHGISQERILEWVAISFSRGSSWLRDWSHAFCISCIGRWVPYPLSHLGSPLSCIYCSSTIRDYELGITFKSYFSWFCSISLRIDCPLQFAFISLYIFEKKYFILAASLKPWETQNKLKKKLADGNCNMSFQRLYSSTCLSKEFL